MMKFSPPQVSMPTLIVRMNGNVTRVPLRHVAVVGRDKGCDVVLDGDKMASRQNTKIYTDGRRFLVEDLSSRNGTFLNGVKVAQPQMLHDGDELRVGGAVIQFEDPASAAPAAAPAPRPSFRRAAVPSASDEAVKAFFGLFSFLLLALIFGTTLVLSKFLFALMLKG
jgi:pSer/pThr/pTyr-binding forkhead associated (FHA) protein